MGDDTGREPERTRMVGEIDTMNRQMVGAQGDTVVVLMPWPRMTPLEALTHAAWLVTVAEIAGITADKEFARMAGDPLPDDVSFETILEAVRNS